MKRLSLILCAAFALAVSCKDGGGSSTSSGSSAKLDPVKVDLKNTNDSAAYALGISVSSGLKNQAKRLSGDDTIIVADVIQGMKDYFGQDGAKYARLQGALIASQLEQTIKNNKLEGELNDEIILAAIQQNLQDDSLVLDAMAARGVLNTFGQKVSERLKEVNLKEGEEFLKETAKKSGVKKLDSGLLYEVIKEGQGEKPDSTDQVKVLYTGKLINGKVFDTTEWRDNEPVQFGLTEGGRNSVIKGWQEGLKLMSPGARYKFYIPASLAYGENGNRGIGPNETLIFDVELVEIVDEETSEPAEGDATPAQQPATAEGN